MQELGGVVTITKKFDFCYGHRLPDYNGKCVNQHGHNSTLEVTIKDGHCLATYPGMVMDFSDLKKVVNDLIVEELDHKYLNDLPEFKDKAPTAENIVRWIVRRLSADDSPLKFCLMRVRVYETPDSYAEWNA